MSHARLLAWGKRNGNDSGLSGLVVRVSALKLGGRGSIPGWVIPKTVEMGPNASLLGTLSIKGWIGGQIYY